MRSAGPCARPPGPFGPARDVMSTPRIRRPWLGLLLPLALLACDIEPSDDCVPATIRACDCSDGRSGVAECQPERRFGGCFCREGVDAGRFVRDAAPVDTGPADTGPADTGLSPDAGATLDAGAIDAGEDAATGDASPGDATSADAAPEDAGGADATVADAELTDTGSVAADAGSSGADAGGPPDA
jgi:hypothetical protein